MAVPSEPIRFQVHRGLVNDLSTINQRSTSPLFFTTIKKVYYEVPDVWERANLPAIAVYPVPVPYPRVLQGSSRTVATDQPYEILGILRDDTADGITLSQRSARLIADINRAIYAPSAITMNLPNVHRVLFPVGAVVSAFLLDQKPAGAEVLYQCLVRYSVQDDNP